MFLCSLVRSPGTGGRVAKRKGGAAPALAGGICVLICCGNSVFAQDAPIIGPVVGLDTLGGFVSAALASSADGAVIVGYATEADPTIFHAVRWSNGSTAPTDLGTLGGTTSQALSVNANGSVIVGYAATAGDAALHAVRWSNGSTAATDLGTLGGTNSFARAVSANGLVIVGYSLMTGNSNNHAAAWSNGSTVATDLGTLGGANSDALAVSADGSVIVGYATMTSGASHAAAWSYGSTVATDLGTLGGAYSDALAVSADGSVIVGYAATTSGDSHAAAWSYGSTTAADLGTLGGATSQAKAVSADGSVIVGSAATTSGDSHAATWLNGSTTATDLGTLGGASSDALAVSANGSVIVGSAATTSGDSHAATWLNGSTTATDLGTLGGATSQAKAVSADGSIIMGVSTTTSGELHAFIVKLTQNDPIIPPEPIIQDYTNLIRSFGQLANDTAGAVLGQQVAIGRLLSSDCSVIGRADNCITVSGNLLSVGGNGNIGYQGAGISQISTGHKFSPNVTIGGSLALGRVHMPGSAFGDSTQTAVSVWSDYSQNGSFSTGLMAHAAIGAAYDAENINRGIGFANVLVSTGTANFTTAAAQATLSYGIQVKNSWLLTPMAGITLLQTSRSAYTETTGIFPTSFDKLNIRSSYASLGFSAQRPINAKSSVYFSAGADIDLNLDRVVLTGTSKLPGMNSVNLADSYSRNRVRPHISAGYGYSITARSMLEGSIQAAAPTYGHAPQFSLGIKYGISF
jgi:probable HAF family extracellular repeat protein